MTTLRTIVTTALLIGVTLPAPVEARRYHRHHDRTDAGDVIAGIAIIAGVAALASAASKSNGWDDDRSRREDDAVDVCRDEAERQASTYGAFATVRDIYDVDRRGSSYRVRGLVEIAHGGAPTRRPDPATVERFTCIAKHGTVRSYQLGGYTRL